MNTTPPFARGNHWIEVIGNNKWVFGVDDNILDMSIEELAKALSQINRFTGHTLAKYPLTVAQHSVFVSELLDMHPLWAMAGLLHDCAEIVISDIASPVKWFLGKEKLAPLALEEGRVSLAVRKALGLPIDTLSTLGEEALVYADRIALVTEKRDLLSPDIQWDYFKEFPRHPKRIIPKRCDQAARMFINRFEVLQERVNDYYRHLG